MGSHHEHWISFSDLMAGVVAVMVLLFVMSMVRGALATAIAQQQEQLANASARRARASEESARAAARERDAREGAELQALFAELEREAQGGVLAEAVDLVPAERRVRLQDAVFGPASACLTPAARVVLTRWSARSFRPFLERHPGVRLAVEGHTDGRPLVVDANTFSAREGHTSNPRCALFDDNFTLSAARAREARKIMVAAWPAPLADRVIVAGYGSSRPRQGLPPSDARHRRVEILVLASDRPELGAEGRR